MSFQAKRLRVQLPCGEATVFEAMGEFECSLGEQPSFICDPNTCVFGEFSRIGPGGCSFGTCEPGTDVCDESRIPPVCRAGSDLPIDPGAIVIDPEILLTLRSQLEAQLKEVETAERLLEERASSGG